MNRVRLASRAQRDLVGIRDWIERDNPQRAVSYLVELIEHIRRLAEHPLIGRARPEMGRDMRSWVHGSFVIFYRPIHEGIDVLRVIHGRKNLRRGLT